MKLSRFVVLFVLLGLLHGACAAPEKTKAKEVLSQETPSQQVLSELYLEEKGVQSKTTAEIERYRVSGLLDVLEYDGPRFTLDWLVITAWLRNEPVNVIVREMNKYLTRSEPRGRISIEVPDGSGGVTLVPIFITRNGGIDSTPMEYFGQRYFEVEFESSVHHPPTSVTFDCRLIEGDGSGVDDKICDSKVTYPIGLMDEGLPNKIFFKLRSGNHRTVNTMAELYARMQVMPETEDTDAFRAAAEDLIKDASGVWIQNLNVARINEEGSPSTYAHIGNGDQRLIAENIDEDGGVEPYGQVKLIPHAAYVKVEDVLKFLADHPAPGVVVPPLPQRIRDIEFAVFSAREPARDVFDILYESDQRGIDKNTQRYHIDEWLPMRGPDLIVFNNVWEKDDGELNHDDCLARGYGLGFDRLPLATGGVLKGCRTDDANDRVQIITNGPATTPRTETTEWVLETQLYFAGGESGAAIEPYGELRVELAGVQPSVASRLVWKDDYRGNSENLTDNGTRFPRAIYFAAGADFATGSTTLRFVGTLYESDGGGTSDDRYYDPASDSKYLQVGVSALGDGLEHTYQLDRTAEHAQRAHVVLRLRKLSTTSASTH